MRRTRMQVSVFVAGACGLCTLDRLLRSTERVGKTPSPARVRHICAGDHVSVKRRCQNHIWRGGTSCFVMCESHWSDDARPDQYMNSFCSFELNFLLVILLPGLRSLSTVSDYSLVPNTVGLRITRGFLVLIPQYSDSLFLPSRIVISLNSIRID